MKKIFLPICVAKYKDSQWCDLDGNIADLNALQDVLCNLYEYELLECQLSTGEVTESRIRKAFAQLMKLPEASQLVIYYTGHGFRIEDDDSGHWIAYEGVYDESGSERKGWIDNGRIVRQLQKVPSRHILLISDTCFSGQILKECCGVSGGEVDNIFHKSMERKVREVLTSCDADEPVYVDTINGLSPFMYHLANILKNMDSEYIKCSVLHERLEKCLRFQYSPRHAQLYRYGHVDGGNFLFYKNCDSSAVAKVLDVGPLGRESSSHVNAVQSKFLREHLQPGRCPSCGKYNDKDKRIFTCLICGRENLCEDHLSGEGLFCCDCVEPTKTCSFCNGVGVLNKRVTGTLYCLCPICNGTGLHSPIWKICPICEGAGSQICYDCGGDGECGLCSGGFVYEQARKEICDICEGTGKCISCDGEGKVECYCVEWKKINTHGFVDIISLLKETWSAVRVGHIDRIIVDLPKMILRMPDPERKQMATYACDALSRIDSEGSVSSHVKRKLESGIGVFPVGKTVFKKISTEC